MSAKARFIELSQTAGSDVANATFDHIPLAIRQIWAAAA